MKREIMTQDLLYNESEIIQYLNSVNPESVYEKKDLVYYPYMFFEHSFERKNRLSPLKGNIGSTVDVISGIAAMVDKTPTFITTEIAVDKILATKLAEEEARVIADDHLFRVVSTKIKVLMTPKVELLYQTLFYRPYWIIEGRMNYKEPFTLIVDAISGKFHPIGE